MRLKIELLDRNEHDRGNFDCGNESLNNYIRKQASQDLKRKVATIFVLIEQPDNQVFAYYTLSSYIVEIEVLDLNLAKKLPRYPLLPATLLGRLAVDKNYQGKKFGELILIDALKKSLDATLQIASLAVVAEAIDENAVTFYKKYGFQQFKNNPMILYISMKSIQNLFDS